MQCFSVRQPSPVIYRRTGDVAVVEERKGAHDSWINWQRDCYGACRNETLRSNCLCLASCKQTAAVCDAREGPRALLVLRERALSAVVEQLADVIGPFRLQYLCATWVFEPIHTTSNVGQQQSSLVTAPGNNHAGTALPVRSAVALAR